MHTPALLIALLALSAVDLDRIRLAPIYPTPQTIVERMLELGGLQASERMCDLGSGDGRIVITAAQKFHANAVGIEIDPQLVSRSAAEIRRLGLTQTARIVRGDLLKQRYSGYDLITVYLRADANDLVQPLLERDLKKGARVVSHDFRFERWRAEKMETIEDAGSGKSHVLYLYRR